MPRKLRFVDDRYPVLGARSGQTTTLWEITTPVIDGRYLLRPDDDCIDIILGVLAQAQRWWRFDVYAFHVMSTHWHLVAGFVSLGQKARVMRFVNGEIARRINRLRGRSGPLFQRRNTAIQITSDAHALQRVKYLMSQGTKAFVVRHPDEDPFASSTPWLLRGQPLRGTWWGEDGPVVGVVEMSPLPGLAHLSPHQQRDVMWEMADAIAKEERPKRKKAGRKLMGAERARTIDPWTRKAPEPKTPPPVIHGTAEQARAWREAYGEAENAYKAATAAFRAWQADATTPMLRWPPCTLPPAFAYVEAEPGGEARAGP
ncbi:MAG: hypothetical protein H6706_29955 [Myxococcales bacterium]|nr:hypothetical protein [Myxococcales bacterium]